MRGGLYRNFTVLAYPFEDFVREPGLAIKYFCCDAHVQVLLQIREIVSGQNESDLPLNMRYVIMCLPLVLSGVKTVTQVSLK